MNEEYVYPYSFEEARRNNELPLCHTSYCLNVNCAAAIAKAIEDGFADNSLSEDCAEGVIKEFGFDRVNWVLANTVQRKDWDGRFSVANRAWANKLYLPQDRDDLGGDRRQGFIVSSHPALVDGFISQARRAYSELKLWSSEHCNDMQGEDITGKVMVLAPTLLDSEYKAPDWQLIYCTGGNGCRANAIGRTVYGKFLRDGDSTQYWRQDFIGELKPELMPDWATEELRNLCQQQEPEQNHQQTM